MTELRRPEPFDSRRHDRSQFECGHADLDDWLRRYAGQNRRGDTAATWVISDARGAVMAYVALSMTGIELARAPVKLGRGSPDPVPALLVGRLAVDRRVAGLGVGTALVAHVLATAIDVNARVACRAVVAVAVNAGARRWWERFGFHSFDPDDPDALDLCLLTSEIASTVASLTGDPKGRRR